MRKIKFRAFWSDTKKPVKDIMDQYLLDSLNCEELIVHQWTGLIDEKGKEIYEGDILSSKGNYINDYIKKDGNFADEFCVVVWNTRNSRLGLISVKDYSAYKDDNLPRLWVCNVDCFKEVVGNVVENPELIIKLTNDMKVVKEQCRLEQEEDFDDCPQCGELAWDGRICHVCGMKNI